MNSGWLLFLTFLLNCQFCRVNSNHLDAGSPEMFFIVLHLWKPLSNCLSVKKNLVPEKGELFDIFSWWVAPEYARKYRTNEWKQYIDWLHGTQPKLTYYQLPVLRLHLTCILITKWILIYIYIIFFSTWQSGYLSLILK